jgi:hypothetical protein
MKEKTKIRYEIRIWVPASKNYILFKRFSRFSSEYDETIQNLKNGKIGYQIKQITNTEKIIHIHW